MFPSQLCGLQGEAPVNNQTLKNCMELMANAKPSHLDLVFQEACLAILPRAQGSLSDMEFKHIVAYAAEQLKERINLKVQSSL